VAPRHRHEDLLGDLEEVHRRRLSRHQRALASALTAIDLFWTAGAFFLERPLGPLRDVSLTTRHATRAVLRQPAFSLGIVGILALGIGVSTAMFAVIHSVLIQPLAIGDAERIVRLLPDHPRMGESDGTFALSDLADLEAGAPAIEAIAAFDGWPVTLDHPDGALRLTGAIVSPAFFSVLGVRPWAGRFFGSDDSEADEEGLVVLSHPMWMRILGGDPAVVGSTLRLDGQSHTVVGIAPPEMEDPRLGRGGQETPSLWRIAPASWYRDPATERGYRFVTAVARLGEGGSLELAREQARSVFSSLAQRFPESNAEWNVRLIPLKERIVAPARLPLTMLGAMVGLLLLITCVNVANLFLVRAAGRGREIGLRLALGASASRVVGQLLAESALLAAIAGTVGAVAAALILNVLPGLGAGQLPRMEILDIDGATLLFGIGLTLLTALLFGLVPAFRMPKDPASALKEGPGSRSGARGPRRIHGWLLATEAGLTVVLLAGASLLGHSYARLTAVDPGFDPDRVLTLRVEVPARVYDTPERVRAALDRIASQVGVVPGVETVGFTNILPFSGGYWNAAYTVLNARDPEDATARAEVRTASGGFFTALDIGLDEGRSIGDTDVQGAPPVAVVNRRLAESARFEGNPIGHDLEIFGTRYRVVGVVADVRDAGLDRPAAETIYLAQAQAPTWLTGSPFLALTTDGPPTAIGAAVAEAIRRVDSGIPVFDVRPMRSVIGATTAAARFRTVLLVAFAALAFLLAALGVYGVVSYTVATRRTELGIRIALGASRRDIVLTLADRELKPVLVGAVVGLAGAALLAPTLESLLYGVGPYHVPSLAGALVALAGAAVLAALRPLQRGMKADPREMLSG
jgi:predicted permease